VTLEFRTGINTGEVIAGDPSQGQPFATGGAVNVAARLGQQASPGEILLGSNTFWLIRDRQLPRAAVTTAF
jgi:class 3 adenylate cyclase